MDDALTCVFKIFMSVQEALRVTKQECTKQYLHRRVKEVKDMHGKSCGAQRQIGIGIPLKSINGGQPIDDKDSLWSPPGIFLSAT